jgi:glycosyltransferase involved in cell wall biosynthesis
VRVGFDASVASGQPGGTGTYAVQLIKALIPLRPDWTFYLYFRSAEEPNPLLREPALDRVKRVIVRGSPNAWWVQAVLPDQLRRDGIDLFHAPGPFLPLRWHGPKVVTIHDLNLYRQARNWMRPGTMLAWADLALQTPFSVWRAAAIITASSSGRHDLHRILRARLDAIRVIKDAPDPFFDGTPSDADLAQARSLAGGRQYVLFVGVLSPQKNLRTLVRAFARSGLARDGAALLLAGKNESGYGAVLEREAESQGIRQALVTPGYVSREQLRALYAQALCLVLPSHGEGFGLPIVEAMACGAPIVAADRQAIPEVVGGAGSLFDPQDEAQLARVLERLLGDPGWRLDLSRRSRARRTDFSWEKTAEQTARVYSDVAHA